MKTLKIFFPQNENKQNIEKRKREKYKVNMAFTE